MPRKKEEIRKNGYAEAVVALLAQAGAMTRRMVSRCMYKVKEDGKEEALVRNSPLSRALNKAIKQGYITTGKEGNNTYYYLTEKGWSYIDEHNVLYSPCMRELSFTRERDRTHMANNGTGIYLASGLDLICMNEDKPCFAEFARAIGSTASFIIPSAALTNYENDNYSVEDLMHEGVYYSIDEISDAYANVTEKNKRLDIIRGSTVGVAFFKDRIALFILVRDKARHLLSENEANLVRSLLWDLDSGFSYYNIYMDISKEMWFFTSSDALLPTIFHGVDDGVLIKELGRGRAKEKKDPKLKKATRIKIDTHSAFSALYAIPLDTREADRRAAFLDPERLKREAAQRAELSRRLGVSLGDVISVTFPELQDLKCKYEESSPVYAIGPEDPLWVDVMSRCLRNKLAGYYSSGTLEPVPHTRYSVKGFPLIGNTQSIDYNAPFKLYAFKGARKKGEIRYK